MYDYPTKKEELLTLKNIPVLLQVQRGVCQISTRLTLRIVTPRDLEKFIGGLDWLRMAAIEYLAEQGILRWLDPQDCEDLNNLPFLDRRYLLCI